MFDIATPDGRRAWAFIAIWIGCVVFTLFAAIGVWLVSGNELYSLILALAAHVQLLIGMGAFGFVLGRRVVFRAGRDGAEMSDRDDPEDSDDTECEDEPHPRDMVRRRR